MKGISSLSKGPVKSSKISQQSRQAPSQLQIKEKLVLSAQWGGCILREQGKLVTVELLQSKYQLACTLVRILVKALHSLILGLHVEVILDLWSYISFDIFQVISIIAEDGKERCSWPTASCPSSWPFETRQSRMQACTHNRYEADGGHRSIWVFWHHPF